MEDEQICKMYNYKGVRCSLFARLIKKESREYNETMDKGCVENRTSAYQDTFRFENV